MIKEGFLLPLLFIVLMISPSLSPKDEEKQPMTGSAARGAASGGMQVAPDLAQRLAKFRRVEMPFHSAGLTEREKKLVEKLVDASRYLENIYWRQSDPEGLDALPIAGFQQEPERSGTAPLSVDQRLALRPDRREPAFCRHHAHAAGPRLLSRGPDPQTG